MVFRPMVSCPVPLGESGGGQVTIVRGLRTRKRAEASITLGPFPLSGRAGYCAELVFSRLDTRVNSATMRSAFALCAFAVITMSTGVTARL